LKTPEAMAKAWQITLDSIDPDLHSYILYVDLCNEPSLKVWSEFLGDDFDRARHHQPLEHYMNASIAQLKAKYPNIDMTYSSIPRGSWPEEDSSFLDFHDLHIWMAPGEFYEKVGYNYELFDDKDYNNVQLHAERLYREKPQYWKSILQQRIDEAIKQSVATNKYLVTSEGWAIVDYKDWPMLDWQWVKELCEYAVIEAAKSGRWLAISTSNFCGPQFKGMWNDIEWHQRLTQHIKSAQIMPLS